MSSRLSVPVFPSILPVILLLKYIKEMTRHQKLFMQTLFLCSTLFYCTNVPDGDDSDIEGTIPNTIHNHNMNTLREHQPSDSQSTFNEHDTYKAETQTVDVCASANSLKILTFNIRYDGGNRLEQNAWNHTTTPRRECAISVIRTINPDIIGLQEVLVNQMSDLVKAFPEYGYSGCGRDDGREKGEYVPLFYRRVRFDLVKSGFFWLSETPSVPGTVFSGSGSIRMASWLILRDKNTNRELFVLNTHLDNASQPSREKSAKLISGMLDSLPENRPVTVMGDFNESETNAAVKILLKIKDTLLLQLNDSYRQVFPRTQTNERTYHAFEGTLSGSRIDFILPDSRFLPAGAAIHYDKCNGAWPSDHFPVSATLRWAFKDDGSSCIPSLSVMKK